MLFKCLLDVDFQLTTQEYGYQVNNFKLKNKS